VNDAVSGSVVDEDFSDAVVGEAFMMHPACGAGLRVVALSVVVPLFSDVTERSRAHAYQSLCPAFGKQLPGNVLALTAEHGAVAMEVRIGTEWASR
jgi:hypothetical protein